MPDVRILNSWKEISQYIGRGVRTVQRWEELYGLPVHRAAGRDRSAVYALSDEVDAWLRTGKMHEEPRGGGLTSQVAVTKGRTGMLVERLRVLRQQTNELRSAISRTRATQSKMRRLRQELPVTLEKTAALTEGRMMPSIRSGSLRNGNTPH